MRERKLLIYFFTTPSGSKTEYFVHESETTQRNIKGLIFALMRTITIKTICPFETI